EALQSELARFRRPLALDAESYPRTEAPPRGKHWCGRRHREWLTLARCIYPRLEHLGGDGRYASLSCAYRETRTVALHNSREAAEAAVRRIDETGCGGGC